jgi:hypothetical protein
MYCRSVDIFDSILEMGIFDAQLQQRFLHNSIVTNESTLWIFE